VAAAPVLDDNVLSYQSPSFQLKQEAKDTLFIYLLMGFWFLHGMQGEFPDDVSGAAVGPETSENSPRTQCKNSKTKNQYPFHDESLKSRLLSYGLFDDAASHYTVSNDTIS
jgi:hypothetical protein